MLIVFLAGYLREKREVLAQGRIKDFGPLLAIWGAAMLVLVETNDLGSGLLYFGIFLAMLYVATARAWFVGAGLVLFVAGAALIYKAVPRVEERVTVWIDPWTHATRPGTRSSSRCTRSRNGGFDGKGFGKGVFATTNGHDLIPFLPDRLHLLGARPGARARRRRRAAARLHALLPARIPGRDAGPGRLLEAARARAHVRLRAADVHHRRRRPADHPADRDHAPLRQLRRVERRRQLRPARGPPARLAPGERVEPARAWRSSCEPPDHARRGRRARPARVADRRDDVLAGLGGERASPTGRTTRSSASPSSRSSAARSSPATATRSWPTTTGARPAGRRSTSASTRSAASRPTSSATRPRCARGPGSRRPRTTS